MQVTDQKGTTKENMKLGWPINPINVTYITTITHHASYYVYKKLVGVQTVELCLTLTLFLLARLLTRPNLDQVIAKKVLGTLVLPIMTRISL